MGPKKIKVEYLTVKVDLFVPNPLRCFNCNKFGPTNQCCKTRAKCQRCGKDKLEEQCDGSQICSNCKGPHAASAKDCPVWKTEKEIQRIRVEKHISFPEARQLVEAKFPSATLTSSISFADVLKRNKSVKSVVCQTELTWVSSDTLVQTVHSVCFWRSRIGIYRYQGFLREDGAGFVRRPGTVRVRDASGQEFSVSQCWTQFFLQAPYFDPGGWVRVQF